MNKQEFIIYLAGFIDGEGSIGISRRDKTYRTFCHITNTNKKVLEMIKEMLGFGYLKTRKESKEHFGEKQVYELNFDKNIMTRKLLKLVYPYLIIKKIQAEIVLNYPIQKHLADRKTGKHHGGRITDKKTKIVQECLYRYCRGLNQTNHQFVEPEESYLKSVKEIKNYKEFKKLVYVNTFQKG